MKTYEQIRGHNSDFIVIYRLYSQSEGGRKVTLQHLRCDFMYDGDNPKNDSIYMIHPEFSDANGLPYKEEAIIPLEGKSAMWILVPEMQKSIHQQRIKIGVKGYFMEGSRKVGEVRVDEIVSLHENPT